MFFFYCFIFFLPFTGIGIIDIGAKVTLSKICVVLAYFSIFINSFISNKNIRLPRLNYDKFIIIFFGLVSLVTFLKYPNIPLNPIKASKVGILRIKDYRFLLQLFNLLLMIGVYFLPLILISSKKKFLKSVKVLFLSAFFVSLYGLYQFVGRFFSWPFLYLTQVRPGKSAPGIQEISRINNVSNIYRVNSTLAEPKLLAFFLIPIILIAFYLFIKRQRPWGNSRIKFSLFILLALFVFLLTFSKSGWILLIFSFIFLSPFWLNKRNFLSSLKIISILGIILFLIFFIFNFFEIPILKILEYRWDNISYSAWKKTIDYPKMKAAVEIFLNNPVFGVGIGNFPFYLANSKWFNTITINVAHNQFLMILVETGIVGFLLFSCFILGLLVWSLTNIKRITDNFYRNISIAFLFATVAMLVTLQYSSQLNHPYFWFYAGMLRGCIRLGLEETNNISHIQNLT